MLRVLALIGLFFALFLPVFLPKSRRKSQAFQGKNPGASRSGLGKMALLVLLPLLPKWIGKMLRWSQGPDCPRCKHKVGRHDNTCPHCGNVLSSVQYRVEKTATGV